MDRKHIVPGIAITTPPSAEPVLRAEAKLNLKIDDIVGTADDTLIDQCITAAREWVEGYCRRQLITATLEYRIDRFTAQIVVPRPPLISVTSVKYIDTAGVEQTLANTEYVVTGTSEPALIFPAYGKTWPATLDRPEAVRVVFSAGYVATGTSVPAAIKQAILLLVSHMYTNRLPVITGKTATAVQFSVESLLSKHVAKWSPE